MSESLLSADRNTHLKIVAVALVAAAVVAVVGIYAGGAPEAVTAGVQADRPAVHKAGQPATYTDSDRSKVR